MEKPIKMKESLSGRFFGDRYQLLSLIGKGGFSEVYKVNHTTNNFL